MKNIILIFVIALGLFQTTNAQVITAVPCDMLGMSVNVGSQETSISIYHSGGYMTHPRPENIFTWEFSDQQGTILHQDTIVDDSFCNFSHSWSLSDTINVKVTLVNDSANLDNWYISEGLSTNGNSINCLFEDQLFWHIDTFSSGTPYGFWTFIHNNTGVDLNTPTGIDNFVVENKRLIKIVDLLGRETEFKPNTVLFYLFSDGTIEKKYIHK
jgi:hypothetical protein